MHRVQANSLYADGAARVSSCAIPPGDEFTYTFVVNPYEGTYFYHAHIGALRSLALNGLLAATLAVGLAFAICLKQQERERLVLRPLFLPGSGRRLPDDGR